MRLTTGKNLVLISITNSHLFKFEHLFFSIYLQLGKKILIFYLVGGKLKRQNIWFWISQKWIEISTPNFHQLLTSMKTRFALKIKVIGAQNLDFLPKTLKTSHSVGCPIFELHPSNLVRIHMFPSCKDAEIFVTIL